MQYFQILACNDTLGTCCNDYGLVALLDIMRKAFDLIQLIIPILLLVMATVQFIQLMANPEMKNGMKKLTNKFIAAVIVFFIPMLVDVMISWMPSNQQFQVSACWKQAKISNEVLKLQKSTYIRPNKHKESTSILINPGDYKPGNPPDNTPGGSGQGSATGNAIVSYAKGFVGQRYVWGGTWNGELPYTGTDCSGFVQGVFKHHGIKLTRTTYSQWDDKGSYTLVNPSDIRAGDLVMYDGHVGILTGNGTELVHAQSTKTGVVLSPDYRTCSSHAILGIMRINGVN